MTFFRKLFFTMLLIVAPLIAQAQDRDIRGTVRDAQGNPLVGAMVLVKGTSVHALTDSKGNYLIERVPSTAVLEFSFMGMVTKEIRPSKRILDITLEDDKQLLGESVVVGYGSIRKGLLTGSVASVKNEKLTASPVANVSNLLGGQLPGILSKQTGGQPGDDSATLSIRGFGSPLVIVDGVESSLSMLDPWQIESVTILKDGSASIYGARAGNGVILVTTKRGSVQKPTINMNTSFTLQGSTRINQPQNSGQRAQLQRDLHFNQGRDEASAPYTAAQVEKYFDGTDPNYLNTDWFAQAVRPFAPQQNHNVSISGGTDRLRYYGFFGVNTQETIIRQDGGNYTRYNFQVAVDANILDNLVLNVDVNSVWENRYFSYLGLYGGSNFWSQLYASDTKLPYELPDASYLAYGGIGYGNIVAAGSTELNGYTRTRSGSNRVAATLRYDVLAVPGLSLKAFVSNQEGNSKSKEFRRQLAFYRYSPFTQIYSLDRMGQDPTQLSENSSWSRTFTQQYSVNYENLFADKHRVMALALFEGITYEGDWLLGSRPGFMSYAIEQLSAGDPSKAFANGGASEMGRASWIGRLNYSYMDKYLVETILRADASAKFPKESRWGLFPSVSLGWVISQENFLRNSSVVDNLKLRLSYGASGNDGISNFAYLSGYGIDGQYILDETLYQGLYVTGLANPTLTWEKMSIYNAGIDFGLWSRKLYGNLDVFYRTRTGIPGQRRNSLPSSFGADLPVENLNAIDTRGFEMLLGTHLQCGDAIVDLSGNITWARSKWLYYDEPSYDDPDQDRLNRKTGQWTDRTIGYLSDGLFASYEDIVNLSYNYESLGDNTKASLRPGDIIYKNVNGDDVLNWRDQQDIGSGSMPKWIYGINASLRWKGLDASLFFQGAFGYSVNVDLTSVPTAFSYDHRWTLENNDTQALVPRYGGSTTNGLVSDYRIHKAAYIRLKDASVGYTLPQKWTRKAQLERARLYISGTNLFTLSTLSKYGVDPEVPDGTGPTGEPVSLVYYYPQQRTMSFGLILTF
ncbi:MAG: TonB-dependent receptor [Bacteroidales bacterium]|nr:TonB-dependent receptor [Bacteroidales bacterium]